MFEPPMRLVFKYRAAPRRGIIPGTDYLPDQTKGHRYKAGADRGQDRLPSVNTPRAALAISPKTITYVAT